MGRIILSHYEYVQFSLHGKCFITGALLVCVQDLVEKVMVLWKGVEGMCDGLQSGHLANRLYDYASVLASQGCLTTALNYLAPVTSDDVRCTFILSSVSSSAYYRA